jgi:hypothetical protein
VTLSSIWLNATFVPSHVWYQGSYDDVQARDRLGVRAAVESSDGDAHDHYDHHFAIVVPNKHLRKVIERAQRATGLRSRSRRPPAVNPGTAA